MTSTDDTPPAVSYTLTPPDPDGDNGWYRSDVALTWRVSDPDSATVTDGCLDTSVTADQPATTYSCRATSDGGTTGPVPVTLKRDATRPDIDVTVSPTEPDGMNGWYVTRPTVSFTCHDETSGIASCPDEQPAAEGQDVVNGTVRDKAGNTKEVTTTPIAVDLTDPLVTCPGTPTFPLGSPATLTAEVSDTGSGPAPSAVAVSVNTSSSGAFTVALTGHDAAGRSTTASCGYEVTGYTFNGFFQPVDNNSAVNVANAGVTVPLKWQVLDAAGAPVTTLTAVQLTVVAHGCSSAASEDQLEEVATGRSGLQNQGGGYYQFNWATQKSYAKTCRTVRLDLGDGVLHTAEFRFK
jgi:hypothetical protein